MFRCLLAMAGAMSLLGSGCTSAYPERPLTDRSVQDALMPPAIEVLRVEAAAIRHPLLEPIEIGAEAGFTPEQVAVLAVLANPSLRAARDARGLAAAQLLQAGLLPNPTLSAAHLIPYAGVNPIAAFGFELNWDITYLIVQQARVQSAAARAASVDLDIASQEWQTAQSARLAAYRVLSLESRLAVARETDVRFQQRLDAVRKEAATRPTTEADVLAVQIAQLDAHATFLEIQADLARQRLQLNRLMGLPPRREMSLKGGSLLDEVPVPPAEQLQDNLENRRLDMLALRRGYESQEANVRAAVLARFPRTVTGLSTGRDTAGIYTVGYSLAIDLPIFDRSQGRIAIEEATRQKLFDEFVSRLFEARSDIAIAVAEIDSLKERIVSAQQAVSVHAALVADLRRSIEAGQKEAVTYHSEWSELNRKKIEVIRLKQQMVEGLISLEISSGLYLTSANRNVPASTASQP